MRLGLAALAIAMIPLAAGCGASDQKASDPSYVESDACRAAAATFVSDARKGVEATKPDTVKRYADLLRSELPDTAACSAAATTKIEALINQVNTLGNALWACQSVASFGSYYGTDDGKCDVNDPKVQSAFEKANATIRSIEELAAAKQ